MAPGIGTGSDEASKAGRCGAVLAAFDEAAG